MGMSARAGEPIERLMADNGDDIFVDIKSALGRAFDRQVEGNTMMRDAFRELSSALADAHAQNAFDSRSI